MNATRYINPTRRLFTRRRSRLSTTLLAFAAIILTACVEPPPPPPAPNYSDLKVDWVEMTHVVRFDNAKVDAMEFAGINEFLDSAEVRLTDQIALIPAADSSPALSRARATAIAKSLRARLPGVRVRLLEPGNDAATRLVVGRYVTVIPECAGWRTPQERYAVFSNPDNQTDANFGCADARNLAATLANPGDFVKGRTLTPADGARRSLAIQKYRKGESPHPHSSTKFSEVE